MSASGHTDTCEFVDAPRPLDAARSYLPSNDSYTFSPVNKSLAETRGNLLHYAN